MPESAFGDILRFLQKACVLQGTCNLSDHELLERFLSNRDEGAFTFLVRRHGPLGKGLARPWATRRIVIWTRKKKRS